MDVIEVLARAWIECDPNREKNADEPITRVRAHVDDDGEARSRLHPRTDLTGKKRWNWFVPRAEATKQFLEDHGFVIVRK
jgi:hypothetical protein